MSKPNGKWSYDFSWTQPYVNMEGFGLFSDQFKGMNSGEIYKKLDEKEQLDQTTQKELDRIASIDDQIDLMDRYPDAEAMIERLKKDFLN
jgi:hypothetical protein